MNIERIKKKYVDAGFSWTSYLEDLLRELGGYCFTYDRPHGGGQAEVWFYDDEVQIFNKSSRKYSLTAQLLNQEVAPVGECDGKEVDLFLTMSGDLIGFSDFLLFSWSDNPSPNWKASVDNLLDGKDCRNIGHAAMP